MMECDQEIIQVCTCYYRFFNVQITDLLRQLKKNNFLASLNKANLL